MKRVVLVSPTYGPVEPEHRDSLLGAVMFAGKRNIEWVGTASTNREGWESARNRPVNEIRESKLGIDGILWADSDMLYQQDTFSRLVEHNLPLVSALYFQRIPPYWPNAYEYIPSKDKFARMDQYPEKTVFPVGAFGFGCVYTSMEVFEGAGENPFKFGQFSEDINFCHAAKQRGFQPYLDTGALCEHLKGCQWVGEKDFKRWREVLVHDGTLKGSVR